MLGGIVQAERHGEFFLRLHILSGDLDLQPRVSAARAGTHSSSAAKARRYFIFLMGYLR